MFLHKRSGAAVSGRGSDGICDAEESPGGVRAAAEDVWLYIAHDES